MKKYQSQIKSIFNLYLVATILTNCGFRGIKNVKKSKDICSKSKHALNIVDELINNFNSNKEDDNNLQDSDINDEKDDHKCKNDLKYISTNESISKLISFVTCKEIKIDIPEYEIFKWDNFEEKIKTNYGKIIFDGIKKHYKNNISKFEKDFKEFRKFAKKVIDSIETITDNNGNTAYQLKVQFGKGDYLYFCLEPYTYEWGNFIASQKEKYLNFGDTLNYAGLVGIRHNKNQLISYVSNKSINKKFYRSSKDTHIEMFVATHYTKGITFNMGIQRVIESVSKINSKYLKKIFTNYPKKLSNEEIKKSTYHRGISLLLHGFSTLIHSKIDSTIDCQYFFSNPVNKMLTAIEKADINKLMVWQQTKTLRTKKFKNINMINNLILLINKIKDLNITKESYYSTKPFMNEHDLEYKNLRYLEEEIEGDPNKRDKFTIIKEFRNNVKKLRSNIWRGNLDTLQLFTSHTYRTTIINKLKREITKIKKQINEEPKLNGSICNLSPLDFDRKNKQSYIIDFLGKRHIYTINESCLGHDFFDHRYDISVGYSTIISTPALQGLILRHILKNQQ